MLKSIAAVPVLVTMLLASPSVAAACTPTGFFRDAINLTAALVNPPGTVSGTVDATGCHIGIYYGPGANGTVKKAEIFGANYFGVVVNGDAGSVSVDIVNSAIHDIGEMPHNGAQHGVAIYYRGFSDVTSVTGRIAGNHIWGYQKGGIVANGQATQVNVMDNIVTGDGHVTFIAQNGIQIGFGATASVVKNTVSENSYIGLPGDGSAASGILVVGGPFYGGPLTVNTRITNNTLVNNDVGVHLSNIGAGFTPPATPTGVHAVNNTITNDLCFNNSYQAAVSDVGNGDKIITPRISGAGYIGCYTVNNPAGAAIDADNPFTTGAKVHAVKFD